MARELKILLISDQEEVAKELKERTRHLTTVMVSCCTIENAVRLVASDSPDLVFVKLSPKSSQSAAVSKLPEHIDVPLVFLPSADVSHIDEVAMITGIITSMQNES